MPRVLLLFEYPTLNGGEQSLLAVLPSLAERDFTFQALAPAGSPLAAALTAHGIRITPLSTVDPQGRRLQQAEIRQQLQATVARIKPDLVHANSLSMGRLVGPIMAAERIPGIGHLRDIIGLSSQAVADLNRLSRLLAVSQATADFHVAQGIAVERTFVLHNGVDLDRFSPRPRRGWLQAELKIPQHAILLGTIGQLVLRKGHDVLAHAAALVAERFPDAHFVIAGSRYSDKDEAREHEQAVRSRFAEGTLVGRGHFVGLRSDIPELLNELTLLIHPARQEPLGRVLLEAAASGLPIVATDVGGTREILSSDSAELVPPGDAAALATAIVKLLDNEPLRRQYATACRQRVVAHFDARQAAAALGTHYHEVLEIPRTRPLT
ncbi:MAG TPA: glycosyltransferase family 4 protein [Pirellulales bacterium]|jgi:glycosyltransferase involved in cell wall biosynthesis